MRVRVDGNLYELSEEIKLEKNIKHNIEIVVDRLVVKEGIERRLTDSIESVFALAAGLMILDVIDGEPINFSQSLLSFVVNVHFPAIRTITDRILRLLRQFLKRRPSCVSRPVRNAAACA